jgi:hypothetical protein
MTSSRLHTTAAYISSSAPNLINMAFGEPYGSSKAATTSSRLVAKPCATPQPNICRTFTLPSRPIPFLVIGPTAFRSTGDEVCVPEALRVIDHRDHRWRHPEYSDRSTFQLVIDGDRRAARVATRPDLMPDSNNALNRFNNVR